jgi:hypothetical protein
MDSFADLTDKLFVTPKERLFCCHYSNLRNNFSMLEGDGLIPLPSLEKKYYEFFSQIKLCYPGIPIVYIHCPSTFEERDEYIERINAIRNIISKLTVYFPNIINIEIERPEKMQDDDFPYHFSEHTYDLVAEKLKEKLI